MNLDPRREQKLLIFGLLIAASLGVLFGLIAEFVAVFLLAFIVLNYSRFNTLYDWAKSTDADHLPFDTGLLGEFAVYVQQCKKQRIEQKESVKYQLERFKKLISVFPDGVAILSLSNEIQWFNKQAANLLVLEKRDVGQPINHLIRHPIFTRFLDSLPDESVIVMDAPGTQSGVYPDKIEVRLLPYGNDERLLLVRDVTKVERANQMRKDFVSNASHELRTPLTVMKGYVEMLLSSAANDDKYTMSLNKIDQQVLKMQTLIEELLVLSRLDEHSSEPENYCINLRELCEVVRVELEPLASEKQQQLSFNIQKQTCLKLNKGSLLTVLRNLVGNAIMYSDKKGNVDVSWLFNEQGEGVLSIRDNGRGIAERHLDRLTERFYRIAENNVLNKTGTGLGLAIVKHELERVGAKLVIESTLGEGSHFQCIFPSEVFEQ